MAQERNARRRQRQLHAAASGRNGVQAYEPFPRVLPGPGTAPPSAAAADDAEAKADEVGPLLSAAQRSQAAVDQARFNHALDVAALEAYFGGAPSSMPEGVVRGPGPGPGGRFVRLTPAAVRQHGVVAAAAAAASAADSAAAAAAAAAAGDSTSNDLAAADAAAAAAAALPDERRASGSGAGRPDHGLPTGAAAAAAPWMVPPRRGRRRHRCIDEDFDEDFDEDASGMGTGGSRPRQVRRRLRSPESALPGQRLASVLEGTPPSRFELVDDARGRPGRIRLRAVAAATPEARQAGVAPSTTLRDPSASAPASVAAGATVRTPAPQARVAGSAPPTASGRGALTVSRAAGVLPPPATAAEVAIQHRAAQLHRAAAQAGDLVRATGAVPRLTGGERQAAGSATSEREGQDERLRAWVVTSSSPSSPP